jgi:tRNA pseudouridine55 synthase
MATGVLLICVGQATKVVRFLVSLEKEYLATMRLGGESDTLDAQGHVSIWEKSPKVSMADVQEVFGDFIGQQEQVPPMFSAVKYRGQPLYRLARRGKTVERRSRKVTIHSLEICCFALPYVTFRISCSSGTYVRVLAADIGQKLNCGAYLTELIRTRLGPFRSQEALSLAQAVALAGTGKLQAHLVPMSRGLEDYPRLVVHSWATSRVLHGQPLTREIFQEVSADVKRGDKVRIEDPNGRLLAMAQLLIDTQQISRLVSSDLACRSLRVLS